MDIIDPQKDSSEQTWKPASNRSAKWKVLAVIAAYAVVALFYRALITGDLGKTGAMFIGLPLLLAALLASAPPARTTVGTVMKGMTLFLLLVAPLLGEGYLCILIAAPLFYLVAAIVALISGAWREERSSKTPAFALLWCRSRLRVLFLC